jgi:trk system potassium uptake protein TrkA
MRQGSYIIPTGETQLQPLDRVVIFTLPEALPKVEGFFG